MHEQCVSDSPNPLTRNQAKTKLRSLVGKFVEDELNIKLNNRMISDDDLELFFTQDKHQPFFIKKEYLGNPDSMTAFIANNQEKIPFLKS